ncbi:phosphotransferase [Oricola thermophila]|uniref:Phosphotransferase n=1 Tax=Oricola thermophila TaxID=2742145 RepID=A0A6N1VF89_9HYPH|nr:aminoglycoside phosphotransferase family protein [Oricola thermophila]QKV17912.1 phosphotransferase [Oricola thermophila]
MQTELRERAEQLLAEIGLARPEEIRAIEPLSGGVASDIARVDLPGRSVAVKFALPKLKVAADWRAPVHRNRAEYEWLRVAAQVAPETAPRLYGRSERLHGFAMEFISGGDAWLWKAGLLAGRRDDGEAAALGALLGRIHAASTAAGFDRASFANRDDFHALRLDPYLLHTAKAYPEHAGRLNRLASSLYEADAVLVHGDVSPKNILFRGSAPSLLDAECATMGDASFDLAFCLNHLTIKALHMPAIRPDLLASVGRLWAAYRPHVAWEDPAALEARVCDLLPALMLARVDGKSPVEYLDETERARLRALSLDLLRTPPRTLAEFTDQITRRLEETA